MYIRICQAWRTCPAPVAVDRIQIRSRLGEQPRTLSPPPNTHFLLPLPNSEFASSLTLVQISQPISMRRVAPKVWAILQLSDRLRERQGVLWERPVTRALTNVPSHFFPWYLVGIIRTHEWPKALVALFFHSTWWVSTGYQGKNEKKWNPHQCGHFAFQNAYPLAKEKFHLVACPPNTLNLLASALWVPNKHLPYFGSSISPSQIWCQIVLRTQTSCNRRGCNFFSFGVRRVGLKIFFGFWCSHKISPMVLGKY